jgi:hypothetical protein
MARTTAKKAPEQHCKTVDHLMASSQLRIDWSREFMAVSNLAFYGSFRSGLYGAAEEERRMH